MGFLETACSNRSISFCGPRPYELAEARSRSKIRAEDRYRPGIAFRPSLDNALVGLIRNSDWQSRRLRVCATTPSVSRKPPYAILFAERLRPWAIACRAAAWRILCTVGLGCTRPSGISGRDLASTKARIVRMIRAGRTCSGRKLFAPCRL